MNGGRRVGAEAGGKARRLEHVLAAALVGLALLTVAFGNDYRLYIIGVVALSALVGTGLNVLMGLAGQISIGHAGFFAIGAYASSLAGMRLGIPFFIAAVLGAVVAGVAGALLSLPALRVRGPYLAMITIAFGFVIEQGAADWKDVTGGWNGLSGMPLPSLFGWTLNARALALVNVLLAAAAIPAFAWLRDSRWGLVMRATRDGETAAQSLGANLVNVRTLAFALSAGITGLAGAFFAATTAFISPDSFPFFLSITFLLIVMVGGLGHPLGPAVGALVVVLLPESLSFLAEYRLMFFGVLLLLVLRVMPNGFMGLVAAVIPRRNASAADQGSTWDPDTGRVCEMVGAYIRPAAPATLRAEGLSRRFGGNSALAGVSLLARPGEITSLIGPNGAGKTTFINLTSGTLQANEGALWLGERQLDGGAPYKSARRGIGRTFQTTQLFAGLSVEENLRVAWYRGRLAGATAGGGAAGLTGGGGAPGLTGGGGAAGHPAPAKPDDILGALLSFVGFQGDPARLAGALPHVERRLVEIARSLAARPTVLLLDEPAAGLSAEEKRALAALLRQLAKAGIAVLLIEHDMGLVMSLSHRVYVLDAGRLIAEGTPAAVRGDPRVRKAYLGEQAALDGPAAPGDISSGGPALPQDAAAVLLDVRRLSAGYGAAHVLEGIDVQLRAGRAAAVLGPNGAGKSTLMRSLAGLHRTSGGNVYFKGVLITGMPAHAIARLGLALVPEGRQLFPELSVEDNIRMGASRRGRLPAADLERLYDLFPKLRVLRQRSAGLLSGGEQQMLALARGLASSPEALLLDEPTIGLAPAIAQELFRALLYLRRSGMTLLLVDQMAYLALQIADEVKVLAGGKLVFSGTPAEVHAHPELERAYFGVEG